MPVFCLRPASVIFMRYQVYLCMAKIIEVDKSTGRNKLDEELTKIQEKSADKSG